MWQVHLTPSGAGLLEDLGEPNLAMHKNLVGHLETAERRQLLAQLEKARASIAADQERS